MTHELTHDCPDGELRDLLPGYAHDALRAAERARVEAHLETCAACADEVELIRVAAGAFPAPSIEVGRIVKALPAAPRRARGTFAGNEWRIAAGIGAFAIGALSIAMLRGAFTGVPAARAPVPASTLAAAQPAETTVAPSGLVARVAPPSPKATGKSISFGGGLGDLTDEQLDTLLGEIDALDALPSAEPEAHAPTIILPREGGHGAE